MKKMVKLFLTAAFVGVFIYNSQAQDDANKAIELYNQTLQAAQAGDFATAIAKSKEAYDLAQKVEGAEETKTNLEKMIPQLYLNKAKKDLETDKFDEALAGLKHAEDEAKKFNDAETLKNASATVIDVHLKQAKNLYDSDDYVGAINAFDKALAIDTTDAQVYLLKANSLFKKGDTQTALETFEKTKAVAEATEKTEVAKQANAQIANIYKKMAGDAQKSKKWADVVSNAEKALEYKPDDATAPKLIDLGNYQQGAALQASNKTKACQFFKKVKYDEKLKANAAQALKALGCN